MARVSTADLKQAYDVLCDHLTSEADDPAIERVAAWLMAEIESRNIRGIAREHGKPMAEMHSLIAAAETR
jgi:hypothetical protein